VKATTHIKRFVKRYWVVSVILIGAILLCAGGNIWYYETQSNALLQAEASSQQQIAEMNAKIKAIQVKKAAEAEKAKQAEQKVAAQKAADTAKSAGSAGATTLDPKVCNTSTTHNNPASIDVVVNKKHCIQPLTYVPVLATSHGATLNTQIIGPYAQLFEAAAAAGQPFYVTSSYRSYATQVTTYNHWISISGQAGADTYSARPGYSEHQTGFAFDVAANGCTLDCFGSTSQYQWFQQHAADYGFIQRYYAGYDAITGYKAEEWHYRYVGVTVAKDMHAKGIKTLEQYWGISGGDY